MGHVAVSNLAYAHPGGDTLFYDVSFRLPAGRHAGLIGTNGVGKSTLMRIAARELEAQEGDVALGGPALYMPPDVGTGGRPGRGGRSPCPGPRGGGGAGAGAPCCPPRGGGGGGRGWPGGRRGGSWRPA